MLLVLSFAKLATLGVDYADVRLQEYSFNLQSCCRSAGAHLWCAATCTRAWSANSDGGFTGFIGAPRVTPTVADLFWYRIATDEQRERMRCFCPPASSNLIDNDGLIFVVQSG